MTRWRAYYADGPTFDSDDGTPEEAPPFGVLCIVQPHPDAGRQILSGFDWYYWHASLGEWWGGDLFGLMDLLLHNEPVQAVKQGRNVSLQRFRDTYRRATTDPDFPPMSGRLPRDRS